MGFFSRNKTPSKTSIRTTTKSIAPSLDSTNSSYITSGLYGNRGGNRDASSPTTPTTPTSKFSKSSPKSMAESGVVMPRCPDPRIDPAGYLKSIGAVRERCSLILEKAKQDHLNHFTVDMDKFDDTVKFVISIIKVCFSILPFKT